MKDSEKTLLKILREIQKAITAMAYPDIPANAAAIEELLDELGTDLYIHDGDLCDRNGTVIGTVRVEQEGE